MDWWEATIDARYHYQKLLNMSNEPTTLTKLEKIFIELTDIEILAEHITKNFIYHHIEDNCKITAEKIIGKVAIIKQQLKQY